jgi:hypothetical protein
MGTANIKFTQLHIGSEVQDPDNHPEYVCENCSLLISAECRNDGDRATRGFKVTFKLDNGSEQYEDVPALSPGESHWTYWRHDAIPYGTHHITVDFDARDRVNESDEFDNEYTQEFWVYGGQNAGHTVDFSGEGEDVIQGDMSWATEAGWRQTDVGISFKNPFGGSMTGYQFMVEFLSHDGEKTIGTPTVGDFEPDAAGLILMPNVWLKPGGYVTVTAIPEAGGFAEDAGVMSATRDYTLGDGVTAVTFYVRQKGDDITVKAASSRQAAEKAQVSGSAKVSILKVVELGASGGKEWSETETESGEMQWRVYRTFPEMEFVEK